MLRKQLIILFFLLVSIIYLSGCQPTPAESVVMFRGDGLPKECIVDPIGSDNSIEVDAPDRWVIDTYRADGFVKIEADIDLDFPAINNIPVMEYEQIEMTDKELGELVHYFIGNSRVYDYPLLTKEELEYQDRKITNREGVYIEPGQSSKLARISAKITKEEETASNLIEKQYVDISFDYEKDNEYMRIIEDAENTKSTEKNSFRVLAETGEKYDPFIKATKYNENAGTSSAFYYRKGAYLSSEDIDDLFLTVSYFEGSQNDPSLSASFDEQKNLDKYYNEIIDFINRQEQPTEAQASIAEKVLEDLSIEGFSIYSIEPCVALNISDKRWDKTFDSTTASNAYEFMYTRSINNISCFIPKGEKSTTFSIDSTPEAVYKPFFGTENIKIVVADGEIYAFEWEYMSKSTNLITSNTKMLPFDICSGNAVNHIGYEIANAIGIPPEGAEKTYMFKYRITGVDLCYYYMTAYDNPERVWSIPVFVFSTDIYQRAYDPKTYLAIGDRLAFRGTVLIDALDGGFVSVENQAFFDNKY